jgi:hypothetical protein
LQIFLPVEKKKKKNEKKIFPKIPKNKFITKKKLKNFLDPPTCCLIVRNKMGKFCWRGNLIWMGNLNGIFNSQSPGGAQMGSPRKEGGSVENSLPAEMNLPKKIPPKLNSPVKIPFASQ